MQSRPCSWCGRAHWEHAHLVLGGLSGGVHTLVGGLVLLVLQQRPQLQ